MAAIKIVSVIAMATAFARGQQLSVLAPREIDKARTKVEDAWAAWQSAPRPEAGLLDKGTKQALAEIDRSAAQATGYLDAKAAFYTRLSEAFHQQAEQIRMEDGHIAATSGLASAERQRVEALLDRERTTRQRIHELEGKADRTARQQFELESLQLQEKDLVRLQDEIPKQIAVLNQIAQDEAKSRTSRAALINSLSEIVAILDDRVEAVEVEKAQWRAYHQQLRELVIERGRK